MYSLSTVGFWVLLLMYGKEWIRWNKHEDRKVSESELRVFVQNYKRAGRQDNDLTHKTRYEIIILPRLPN